MPTMKQTEARNVPDFTVYFVPDREGCSWVPIGAAWQHRDGDGFNLTLSLLPATEGRILLRRLKARPGQDPT